MKGLGYLFGRLALVGTLVCATVIGSVSPAAAASVSKSFTTHSQSSNSLLVVGGEQFTFAVSGTWVGTVKLQKSRNGADFKDVIGYEAVTANTSVTLTADTALGQRTYYRVYASTYTSGTIVTSLTDVSDIVQQFRDRRSNNLLLLNDDNVQLGTGKTLGSEESIVRLDSPHKPYLRTKAQLHAISPAEVGLVYTCSDCTRPYTLVVSTGTGADMFRESGLGTGAY